MGIVSALLASLWLIGISSPRTNSGMIHLLLISSIVLLAVKVYEAARDRRNGVRKPWMRMP